MTRSHALLHCPNATLAAARVEAWEGRNPSGIRVLLSDPRWESRLLKFLELSGVGRYVKGGVDEDQAHAEMDSVGGGGGGGKVEPGPVTATITTTYFSSFPYFLFLSFVKGDPYPEI
jgi:hypothetical protein